MDDLAELYCLAIERAPAGAALHGTTADISQHHIAAAIGRLIGAGAATESLTMNRMLGMNALLRAGMLLTRHIPDALIDPLQAISKPPANVATGLSLSLNKRLSSLATQQLLGWSPRRADILVDIESGSYADRH
jgi:hypothetical protein